MKESLFLFPTYFPSEDEDITEHCSNTHTYISWPFIKSVALYSVKRTLSGRVNQTSFVFRHFFLNRFLLLFYFADKTLSQSHLYVGDSGG